MKRNTIIAIAGLGLCVGAAAQSAPPTPVPPKTAPATHLTKDDIQDFISKMPKGRILDTVIRAVDVGAVNRAAEVSATQAQTLATQVAVSAETLCTQVAAAATAASTALSAALEPIQKDIADLRRAQYEAQGQKTQVVETRDTSASKTMNINAVMAVLSVIIAALVLYAALHK